MTELQVCMEFMMGPRKEGVGNVATPKKKTTWLWESSDSWQEDLRGNLEAAQELAGWAWLSPQLLWQFALGPLLAGWQCLQTVNEKLWDRNLASDKKTVVWPVCSTDHWANIGPALLFTITIQMLAEHTALAPAPHPSGALSLVRFWTMKMYNFV